MHTQLNNTSPRTLGIRGEVQRALPLGLRSLKVIQGIGHLEEISLENIAPLPTPVHLDQTRKREGCSQLGRDRSVVDIKNRHELNHVSKRSIGTLRCP